MERKKIICHVEMFEFMDQNADMWKLPHAGSGIGKEMHAGRR